MSKLSAVFGSSGDGGAAKAAAQQKALLDKQEADRKAQEDKDAQMRYEQQARDRTGGNSGLGSNPTEEELASKKRQSLGGF